MAALSADLDYIRDDLFKDTDVTSFSGQLQQAVIDALTDPKYALDELARYLYYRSEFS